MENFEEKDPFTKEIMSLIEEIQSVIKLHKDDRKKDVGDRVIVWDGSYNVDKNTGVHRAGIDKLFQNHGIVIETNCNFTYHDKIIDDEKTLDLLIKFDTGEEVYTQSEMVKRIDKDNL